MRKIITQSIISAIVVTSVGLADEVALSDVEAQYSAKSSVKAGDELKQSINLGFSNTTGNTDTLNLNGKYDMSFTTLGYNNHKLKVGFDASAFLSKNDSITSNEEYTANLGLEQYIVDGWLGYGAINWLRNPDFKNFDNKFSIGVGVGKELFNDGQHSFKVKLGVAYNIQQYADATEDAKFGSLNEYLEYVNKLNKTSTLFVKVGASENFDDFKNDYEVLAAAGLNFSVAENISVTIEEEVLYDKIHPGTAKATDTKSIVRVGYNF
jgi:putative salt-induced outer membrane protein YdiY